jgi:hippurate hydrolase
MDALPVEEKTGLPYASHARAKDASGADVPVMHACGHDLHMAAWTGTAIIMARSKSQWSGTLMFVAQPAEETVAGAKAMLNDGLFTRFPKPDFVLAIHVHDAIPSGMVGITPGFPHANSDSVDITIFGRGGHGARPHLTIDPIVIAARVVLAIQTIVARETDPFEPTVVTIGSIHAGSTHNVIPDEAKLQLTVRTFKPDVRERVLAAIKRIANAEAAAAGAPKAPAVKITAGINASYNDPSLASRAAVPLRQSLGPENVLSTTPRLGGEDFSEYTSQGVPGLFLWVGAVEPARFEAA